MEIERKKKKERKRKKERKKERKRQTDRKEDRGKKDSDNREFKKQRDKRKTEGNKREMKKEIDKQTNKQINKQHANTIDDWRVGQGSEKREKEGKQRKGRWEAEMERKEETWRGFGSSRVQIPKCFCMG